MSTARYFTKAILLLLLLLSARPLSAQTAPEGIWQGYDGEWKHVSKQLIDLAEATPEEKFSWRPTPGVRSTSEVYMHIALTNFYLLSVTGPKMPAELNREMEKERDRQSRRNQLAQAFAHRRKRSPRLHHPQRSRPQSPHRRSRRHRRRHVSPPGRPRQRTHGPTNSLRPHVRRHPALVQAGVTPTQAHVAS